MNAGRALIVAVMFAGCAALLKTSARASAAGIEEGAPKVPYLIGDWRGRDALDMDRQTMRLLGADEYLNRTYSMAAEPAPLGLYVAYYARQRPGASIHSPLHCLPGTGWETLDVATVAIPQGARPMVNVRRLEIRKDLTRAVVLYWYALHGRIVASEWSSKFWLLGDALRSGRTDGALVRIVVPVANSIDAANAEAVRFAERVIPYVDGPYLAAGK